MKSTSADKLVLFTWGISALLGLIEWEDAISEWRALFSKMKECRKYKPIATSYTNWFGESLFNRLVNCSPDGLDGANKSIQIDSLIFHSFYVLEKAAGD